MDEVKANQELVKFWDEQFRKANPVKVTKSDFIVKNDYDDLLKFIGNKCESVLDLGTGHGYGLLSTNFLGKKIKYGLGIDTSIKAINYLNEVCELSSIENLDFLLGSHLILNDIDDNYFDGAICSNVLDVVPNKTSAEMINVLRRVIKPNGYLLVKLNFCLNDELIKKLNMVKVSERSYKKNGVLRAVNYTTEEWIKRFVGFEIIKTSEFERIKDGPKDRLLLLKKMMDNEY